MDALTLVTPHEGHAEAAAAFKAEFFAAGETVIHGGSLLDQLAFPAWLAHLRASRDPATCRPDWVCASTFFALRKEDGALVGVIDLRHSLDDPFLAQYGGHIGYSVRPSQRRRGYATQMLTLVLDEARALGLPRVMLGALCENTASNRTILRCGGVCTATQPYADGAPMNVYWIDLPLF